MRVVFSLIFALNVCGAQKHFIWAVSDSDSTVYVAGVIHGMFENAPALPGVYLTILQASDRLVLEADFDTLNSSAAQNHWDQRATEAAPGDVPAGLKQSAQTLLLNHGVFPLNLKTAWSMAVTIETLIAQDAGINFDLGVDYRLFLIAKGAGISISGLEDFREHIDTLPSVPLVEQIQWLESSVDSGRSVESEWKQQIQLWESGDLEELAALDSTSDPGYSQVFASRNRRWLPKIAALLEVPGISLVAVGASHLGRQDGILAGLTELGLKPIQLTDPELTIERSKTQSISIQSNMVVGNMLMETSADLLTWRSPSESQASTDSPALFWRAVWTP